uniref:PaaI family thioesterase n=1 Tax=Variovorax paradoxus TaxID=34073 RepID=UPI003D64B1D1
MKKSIGKDADMPHGPTEEGADLLDWGRQALAGQPFSVLLGAAIDSLEPGAVQLHLPITPALKQQHGFVHGGVLSYLADNALAFAGGTAMGAAVVTSEFKINFVRPAQGDRLIARARCTYAGRTQAVCVSEVFVADESGEKLCAVAQGTISRLAAIKQPEPFDGGAPVLA